ncbi:MAG TPA: adenylate/guanylate cyclase domain-containing protein, partial [Methylomirabilota bacterium]
MRAGSRPFNILHISLPANLIGAAVTFAYFRFIDPAALDPGRRPGAGEILASLVVFGVLAGVGFWLGSRWSRPLRSGPPPDGPAGDRLRRRAAQLPWIIAAIQLVAWTMAGLIWGVLWPALAGPFDPVQALRSFLGISVFAGSAATAFMFFVAEQQWRRQLPAFFPDGGLTRLRGVPRLPVRARLLVVLLLIGVLPVSVLGVLARNRARAALAATPEGAEAIVANLLVSVVFLAVAAVVVAIALALAVSRSVAEPLAGLEAAMVEVERGNFQARAPVVSNDEIGRLTEGFNRMVRGLGEREFLRETFGKYVSQEIRDEILAGRVALQGEPREVTILFADIRDFTPWVEASDPREVVRDLNAYFTEMETAIRAHGGLVVQYIGDEIEALFGAPVPRPRHAEQAVRAALEMRRRLAAWNAARAAAGRPPLRNGIGIHTGTVLAGNIGSADRLSYALVGDSVNLAARLQGLTKELRADVLVSGTT